jgi:hypothetical protein
MNRTGTRRNVGLSDDELIARAIENGWEQLHAVTDRWPGSRAYPWTGWLTAPNKSGLPCGRGPRTERRIVDGQWTEVVKERTWASVLRGSFDHNDRCEECGQWIAYSSDHEDPTVKHGPDQFCWLCKFWLDRVPLTDRTFVAQSRAGTAHQVTHGAMRAPSKRMYYGIGTATRPSSSNGFSGAWWVVTFNDGRQVETCDLWCGGDVPEQFWDRLPVTAELRGGRL